MLLKYTRSVEFEDSLRLYREIEQNKLLLLESNNMDYCASFVQGFLYRFLSKVNVLRASKSELRKIRSH